MTFFFKKKKFCTFLSFFSFFLLLFLFSSLWNVKHRLQLLDQCPLLHRHVRPVELLQRVDARPRDGRVQRVLLLQVPSVHGLVLALDLDRHGGLAPFADLDGLVVAFDGYPG